MDYSEYDGLSTESWDYEVYGDVCTIVSGDKEIAELKNPREGVLYLIADAPKLLARCKELERIIGKMCINKCKDTIDGLEACDKCFVDKELDK